MIISLTRVTTVTRSRPRRNPQHVLSVWRELGPKRGDASATCRPGSRGATVARVVPAIAQRVPCSGRDAASMERLSARTIAMVRGRSLKRFIQLARGTSANGRRVELSRGIVNSILRLITFRAMVRNRVGSSRICVAVA
jgi:hypothetical protein